MLPEGWKNAHLASLCEKISDGIHTTPDYDEHSDVFFVNGNNIQTNGLNFFENTKRVSRKDYEKYKKDIGSNTILMSINGTIGNTCLYNNERVVLGKSACYLNVKENTDLIFILHSLRSSHLQNYFLSELTGTTIRNLSLKTIKSSNILLPPLPEQKKIAAILSTWDRAIEGTEKLLANSQQQKKALMQQLLTGKKRLPGFTGEWKNYTLENILNVRKEKSLPSNKIPLFSLTIEDGITSKTDRYNREFLVKNKNEKKYKVVYPRDLVYNPANLRWGAINYSRIPHKVVVSPIYEVLYVNNIERFFPDLIYQYLMSPFQIEKFSSMIEGTLMERKSVKISPFLATKIRIPSEFPEQEAIAAVLTTADEEIASLESDLSRLRQEKKALMQQLLTGKRRVTVD